MFKKPICLLVILCLLLQSCSIFESKSKDTYSYEFVENSRLEINQLEGSYMKYGLISEGSNTVFIYRFEQAQDDDIADYEYIEHIRFQISPELDSFSLIDNDLVEANTVLSKACFCGFGNDEEKNIDPFGSIDGEKLSDDTWDIKIDVTFYGDEKRTIEAIFKLKSQ